jgi:hypothetical protein
MHTSGQINEPVVHKHFVMWKEFLLDRPLDNSYIRSSPLH